MKTSHRIALRLSEIRQQLNEWPEDGKAEELDTLTTEYRQQEAEYRAALVTEDSESGSIRNNQTAKARRCAGYARMPLCPIICWQAWPVAVSPAPKPS